MLGSKSAYLMLSIVHPKLHICYFGMRYIQMQHALFYTSMYSQPTFVSMRTCVHEVVNVMTHDQAQGCTNHKDNYHDWSKHTILNSLQMPDMITWYWS